MSEQHTEMRLTIRNRGKGVPYGGSGIPREDGSANYGFKALKGKREEAALINEVQDEPHFRDALVAINDLSTPFFTVGCEKSFNQDEEGHWAKGYIEFAFNYCELAGDAQWYFKLFFDLNHFVWQGQFNEPVRFHFELEGAHFSAGNCAGYTLTVWITTAFMPTAEEVREIWGKSVDLLVEFLKQYPAEPSLTPMY
jgi:hypothetical protein